VLSGRGLCDELITRPEESYRLCCVVVCDLETSRMGAPYIYDISHLRVKLHSFVVCILLASLLKIGRPTASHFNTSTPSFALEVLSAEWIRFCSTLLVQN